MVTNYANTIPAFLVHIMYRQYCILLMRHSQLNHDVRSLTPDVEQIDEVVSLAHCKQLPVGYGADQFGTTSVDGVQVGLGVGRWLEREKEGGAGSVCTAYSKVSGPAILFADLPMTLGSHPQPRTQQDREAQQDSRRHWFSHKTRELDHMS